MQLEKSHFEHRREENWKAKWEGSLRLYTETSHYENLCMPNTEACIFIRGGRSGKRFRCAYNRLYVRLISAQKVYSKFLATPLQRDLVEKKETQIRLVIQRSRQDIQDNWSDDVNFLKDVSLLGNSNLASSSKLRQRKSASEAIEDAQTTQADISGKRPERLHVPFWNDISGNTDSADIPFGNEYISENTADSAESSQQLEKSDVVCEIDKYSDGVDWIIILSTFFLVYPHPILTFIFLLSLLTIIKSKIICITWNLKF